MSDLPTSPYANTIFCDDIRQENNGKHIFIGVYTGGMNYGVPAPQMINLSLFMTYVEPPGYSTDEVRFEIVCSGHEEPLVAGVPIEEGPRPDVIGNDPENRLAIMVPLRIPPLMLEEDAKVRVRWYCGNRSIHGGSLRINFAEASPVDADVNDHNKS